MTKIKSLITVFAAILTAAALSLLFGCSSQNDVSRDYVKKDLSGYDSQQLEEKADYGAFYKPQSGEIGDIVPYYYDGTYYIFYTKTGKDYPSHPVYLMTTTDFTHFTEGECVLSAMGLSGESVTGVCSVLDVYGTYYMFYKASTPDGRETLRVAVSDSDFYSFTRKQNFIIHPDALDYDRGFIDASVTYDAEIGRFVCVISAVKNGVPALELYYFDDTLGTTEVKGTLYEDRYGFAALESPTLFELDGSWYITYYAKTQQAAETAEQTASRLDSGKMYYLVSDSLVGPYKEGGAALDSAAFKNAKAVCGDETLLVGSLPLCADNDGKFNISGSNIATHTLYKAPDGALAVTYPRGYTERFSQYVPTAEKSAVTVENTAAVIADEIPGYRLTAKIKYTESATDYGFIFGYDGTDGVRVTIDPRFGKIKASYAGIESASAYISLEADKEYRVDIFTEGSCYTLYIGGTAFTFRARNTGNKKIAAFVTGGSLELGDIAMYASGNAAGLAEFFALDPGESKEVSITTENDSYVIGEASIYSEANVTVSLICGEETKSTSGSGFIDFSACIAAYKGAGATLRVTAAQQTAVFGTLKLREDYREPQSHTTLSRITTSRGATLAAEKGMYTYEALVVQESAVGGILTVECGGEIICETPISGGYARAYGTAEIKEKSDITASVVYHGEISEYTVRLAVKDGAEDKDIKRAESAVSREEYDLGITPTGNHDDRSDALASFGAQGNNGFAYVYGKMTDEPIAYADFADNKYTAANVSQKLSASAGKLTAGDGYVSGIAYTVKTGGALDVKASVKPDAAAKVRIAVNRITVREVGVEANGEFELTMPLRLLPNDRVMLTVESVGADGVQAACNLAFAETVIETDKNFRNDFYTDINAANNWLYGYSKDYKFESNTFTFTRFDKFESDAWKDSTIEKIEIKNGWLLTENKTCDAAVGYKFDKAGSYNITVDFDGTNDGETRLAARVLTVGANGATKTATYFGEGHSQADWSITHKINVEKGDTVYVIFFREYDGWTQGSFDITIKAI